MRWGEPVMRWGRPGMRWGKPGMRWGKPGMRWGEPVMRPGAPADAGACGGGQPFWQPNCCRYEAGNTVRCRSKAGTSVYGFSEAADRRPL